ncbi:MAG: xanthine dehydrogenase accessory protein XdhC [Candidatus Omnitrophota bacterium]
MNLLSKIEEYLSSSKKFALVTIVDVKGSTPRQIGARMIVFSNGSIEGTIGGGKIEYDIQKDSQYLIRHSQSCLKEYSLNKERGLLCGGKMSVFIEVFKPKEKIIIFGAGHIGKALYKLASVLDFEIIIIDQRKEFAKKDIFPNAKKIICKSPMEAIKELNINKNSYIVIVTHGHEHDYIILKNIIKSSVVYIGMIGSKNKIKSIFNKLRVTGISQNLIKKIYAPIGLNLGGDSPEEIALSILAEIVSIKNRRKK